MGGHGALVSFLRPENRGLFRSVSAFAPICHPSQCPWGQKAFTGYLGEENKEKTWAQWDATELARKYDGAAAEILIDQGGADEWLAKGQLLPEHFVQAAKDNSKGLLTVNLRQHDGYDHSYFFIQTFVEEHIQFHAKHLNQKK